MIEFPTLRQQRLCELQKHDRVTNAIRLCLAMEPTTLEAAPQLTVATQPVQKPRLSSRKDCVFLRGLPYEAQGDTIVRFLGECAPFIVHEGVHVIYMADGRPSGDAFVQMDSERSASLAAARCHRRYIRGWKKLRYVEVYKCSMLDISNLGAMPVPKAVLLPPILMPLGPFDRRRGAHPRLNMFARSRLTAIPFMASPLAFQLPIAYWSRLSMTPVPQDGRRPGAHPWANVQRLVTSS
ncbi:RNA-binding protein fusilli-like [Haemaphysalis longicornis]